MQKVVQVFAYLEKPVENERDKTRTDILQYEGKSYKVFGVYPSKKVSVNYPGAGWRIINALRKEVNGRITHTVISFADT